MTRYRVLIVDDHPIFIRGLRGELEDAEDVEVVGECANGEDAIAFVDRERPDVVLVDLRMPRLAGAEPTLCGPEVIGRILELAPTTRLLVLSSHEEPEHVRASLEAGAAGYLCKEQTSVVQSVRTVAEGNVVLDERVIAGLLDQRVSDGDLPFRLTRSEFRQWKLMGKGLTNQRIAAELFVSAKTVANRSAEIQTKLDARDRAEVVEKARRQGFGGTANP